MSGDPARDPPKTTSIFSFNDQFTEGSVNDLDSDTSHRGICCGLCVRDITGRQIIHNYVDFLQHYKVLIVLFWLGFAIWGAWMGHSFASKCDSTIPATPGSLGEEAHLALARSIPHVTDHENWAFIINCPSDPNNAVPWIDRNSTLAVYKTVRRYIEADLSIFKHDSESYFDFLGTKYDKVKAGFLSKDGNSWFIKVLVWNNTTREMRTKAYNAVLPAFESAVAACDPTCFGGLTGPSPLLDSANTSLETALESADLIVIPIAFLILGYMITNWRLLLITLSNMLFVVAISFGLMVTITENGTPAQSISPQFIEVMTIAMSVDYSLFFFTRFNAELSREMAKDHFAGFDALFSKLVYKALFHSGHVIFMSGSTVVISFFGLFFLNCPYIALPGLGNAIAVTLCVACSLTLTPSVLLLFPAFFSDYNFFPSCVYAACCPGHRVPMLGDVAELKHDREPSIITDSVNVVKRRSIGSVMDGKAITSSSSSALSHPLLAHGPVLGPTSSAPSISLSRSSPSPPTLEGDGAPRGKVLTGPGSGVGMGMGMGMGMGGTGSIVKDSGAAGVASHLSGRHHASISHNSSHSDLYDTEYDSDIEDARMDYSPTPEVLSSAYVHNQKPHTCGQLNPSERKEMEESNWYALSVTLTTWPSNILVVCMILALCGLCCTNAVNIQLTSNIEAAVPSTANALVALEKMESMFGDSSALPFFILIADKADTDNAVKTANFLRAQQAVRTALINRFPNLVDPGKIACVSNANGKDLNILEVDGLLLLDAQYQFLWGLLSNRHNSSSIMQIGVHFDPLSNTAYDFITGVREVLEPFNNYTAPTALEGPAAAPRTEAGLNIRTRDGDGQVQVYGGAAEHAVDYSQYSFYLAGQRVVEADTVNHATGLAPTEIILTCLFVFVALSFFLKSMLTPFRLLFTLVIPVGALYGIAVAVYQDGVLNFLNIPAFSNRIGAFYWDVPIIAFNLIAGLALDYDVFLITRIVEHRVAGFSNAAAIRKSIFETSRVITAAGVIMATAFSILLMAPAPAVQATGFLLTSSVLFDTFIIRTLLVPALLSLSDNWAWYPRAVPLVDLRDEFGDLIEPAIKEQQILF